MTQQSDGGILVMLDLLGNAEYPFIAIAPSSILAATDRVLSRSQIERKCVLMLNWIALDRTGFDILTAYICSTELFEMEQFYMLN